MFHTYAFNLVYNKESNAQCKVRIACYALSWACVSNYKDSFDCLHDFVVDIRKPLRKKHFYYYYDTP